MELDKTLNDNWSWAVRYVAVILISLILAAALGHMELFQKATVGGKLHASHLVEFMGYGAALVLFWMLGRRATIVVQDMGGKLLALEHLILPVVSIFVLALAYSVVLLLLKPFLGPALTNIFDWSFVILILACAGWLVMAVLNQSAPLTALLTRKKSPAPDLK